MPPPTTITTSSSSTTKPPAPRGEYIETETGNKISRRATILGPKHIVLAGKCVVQHDVVIHGDLVRPKTSSPSQNSESQSKQSQESTTSIHLGRYVFISSGCTLRPPSRVTTTTSTTNTNISSSLSITTSSNSQPNTSTTSPTPPTTQTIMTYYPLRISDHVYIGPNTHVQAGEIKSNVWIGANCVLGNMCLVKENVRILDGTVIPPNSVWASGSIVAGRPGRVVGELGEGWGVGLGGAGGGGSGGGGSGGGRMAGDQGGGMISSVNDEGIGLRSRERWASVGNKR